jgi:hypothetical protein
MRKWGEYIHGVMPNAHRVDHWIRWFGVALVIDRGCFWDDVAMVSRALGSVACAVACVFGCAAEQVDDMPQDSGDGAKPSTGGSSAGGTAGTNSTSAGSPSATSGAATKGGAGGAGVAGSGQAGKGGALGTAGAGGSGPTKPADTNLPFSEDFEDGEPNGFISWNEDMMAGPWAVVADGAGKIYQPQAVVSELEFAVGGSTAWTDVIFSVKVRLNDAESDAQIVMRFKDPKTYLVVEMAEGKFKLRGRADGSTQDLVAPSPKPVITAGTWYTVGVTAKGSMVTLTLDGAPIGAPTTANAAISNGGVALGVSEGSVSFDDVKVVAAP